jgi:hypothetical protein
MVVKATSSDDLSPAGALYGWVWVTTAAYAIFVIIKNAYQIRMGAIEEYGPVIHEFDPYFNFRATEVSTYRIFWGVWSFLLTSVGCHVATLCQTISQMLHALLEIDLI